MASFLTGLLSVGSQYGEAKDEARKEKEARAQKIHSMDVEDAYLQIARQAENRNRLEAEQKLKTGRYLKVGSKLWDIEKSTWAETPGNHPMESLKKYISTRPEDQQAELQSVAEVALEADPGNDKEALTAVLNRSKQLQDEANRREDIDLRARKTDPIITAQIGKAPDPKDFPQGATDPKYKLDSKKWGIEAETIKTRMASAGAEARGKSYNMWKTGPYLDQTGQLITATAGEALAKGLVPYQAGFQSMSRTQQIREMQGASGSLRSAIMALQPGDAFDPISVAQLRAASNANDENTFHAIINGIAAETLNPRQQDYLVWLQQMGERVLSLRNVAGMGQGAQDLRRAIQATLPGFTSGNKELAIKLLDAVDNQVNILGAGIPHTNIKAPQAPDNSQKGWDDLIQKKFGPPPAPGGNQ